MFPPGPAATTTSPAIVCPAAKLIDDVVGGTVSVPPDSWTRR